MPITKCAASKATPAKGLAYIFDPLKTLARGGQGFLSQDPKQMAEQMMRTMNMFGKGLNYDERKYYHVKVSLDPKDLKINGGILDEKVANRYAARYAAATWPGREVAWSIQHHGEAMHIHFIVAACHMETGKKLDARNPEYRAWKDAANDLAAEMDLSTINWREATRKKREGETLHNPAIYETFGEKGLKAAGKATWKDELRDIVDQALAVCGNLDEFQLELASQGVQLTRCTDKTISYKLGEHKAVRGDTLGSDYTRAAVGDALEHNAAAFAPVAVEGKKKAGLDAIIGHAGKKAGYQPEGKGHSLSIKDRNLMRDLGRMAGMTRREIDELCNATDKATWTEKQEIWGAYSASKDEFWREYNRQIEEISKELDAAYKRRRELQQAQWMMNPYSRRRSLVGKIMLLIYVILFYDGVIHEKNEIESRIADLHKAQNNLRKDMANYKTTAKAARENLKEKGLSVAEYAAAVKRMEEIVDWIQEKYKIRIQDREKSTSKDYRR